MVLSYWWENCWVSESSWDFGGKGKDIESEFVLAKVITESNIE